MESGDGYTMGIIMGLVLLMAYFLPTLVAQARGRDGLLILAIGNLLLAWTVVGWFVLLIIAFTGESASVRKMREEQLELVKKLAGRPEAPRP